MSSCMVPYSSYDYNTPRQVYYPYTYQPTKVIVVKQKHNHKHNKRHVKVKINKHRKTK